jgi:hypothetical protein
MNDDTPLTAEQLQQATSRALPQEVTLDAETAALRGAFLQLGNALDAAAGDFDGTALLEKVVRAQTVAPAATPSRFGTRSWLPVVLTAALAASALLAIMRTVAVWPASEIAATAPAQGQTTDGSFEPQPWSADWSDPLDDEIASAQVAVDWLETSPTDLDGSLNEFGSRLQSLAAELESGSL